MGEPLATALADDGLDEVVAALRTFALIDRGAIVDERDTSITTDVIRLHRLVREVAAARREGESREQSRRALVAALAVVYPHDSDKNPTSWPRRRSRRISSRAARRKWLTPLRTRNAPGF